MPYKNIQITIRLPSKLNDKLKTKAWEEKTSRNKLIENIILKTFNMPESIPHQMSNIIWNKLDDLENKINTINESNNNIK